MEKINIQIDSDQALVLFEFLAELGDGNRSVSNLLPAEELALSGLEAALEEVLVHPFEDNYANLLADARARLEMNSRD